MPPVTEAQIAHHIPGRLRLRVPRLRHEPELAEQLSQKLRELEEVVTVAVRPGSGSVLVSYQPNGRGPEEILESLAPVVRLREPGPPRRPEPPPDVSIGEMIAEATHDRWQRLNEGLKRGTDGALDMGTVVLLFFIFLAIRQVITQPHLSALPWYTALYYGFQTFNRYYGRPTRPARSGWSRGESEEGAD